MTDPLSKKELMQLLQFCRRISDNIDPKSRGLDYKARRACFALREWGTDRLFDNDQVPIFEKGDGNMFDSYLPRNGPTDPLDL